MLHLNLRLYHNELKRRTANDWLDFFRINTFKHQVKFYCGEKNFFHDFEKSKASGQKATNMNPNDPRVISIYGEALIRLNELDKGLLYLQKAYELDPIPQGQNTSCERYENLSFGYFCKNDYKKCLEWGNKIEHMDKTIWLIILYSISKVNGIHKIKESDIFKKYEGSFKDINWKDVIDSIRFKPEDKKINFLLAFANKIFPELKIVDKTA